MQLWWRKWKDKTALLQAKLAIFLLNPLTVWQKNVKSFALNISSALRVVFALTLILAPANRIALIVVELRLNHFVFCYSYLFCISTVGSVYIMIWKNNYEMEFFSVWFGRKFLSTSILFWLCGKEKTCCTIFFLIVCAWLMDITRKIEILWSLTC